ncbi:MAG: DNA-3-methyladenine glycosylase [Candidatus Korarchaeota archaeon]|nr:DNA-3-methyladenine glycosylase [Candidatus Korarchaeota archaeon]
MGRRLGRSFFCRDPVVVAKELLGKLLVRELEDRRLAGIVVETEAYLGVNDRASHGYGGRRTLRMWPLYSDCGLLYIYPVHGYSMLNITVAPPKEPTAVLIRALEPVEGVEIMMEFRNTRDVRKLCSGPGRLTKALKITQEMNGLSVADGPVYFEEYMEVTDEEVVATKRVGVDYAGRHADLPLRFYVRDSKFVSKP